MKKKNGVIKGRTMSEREREKCVTDTERMRRRVVQAHKRLVPNMS